MFWPALIVCVPRSYTGGTEECSDSEPVCWSWGFQAAARLEKPCVMPSQSATQSSEACLDF
jgi:hypothetical protein